MRNQNQESFLRNAKKYIEYHDQGNFSHDYDELCERARKGERPCPNCARGESCGSSTCLPFYIWFRGVWKNIQKQAGIRK